ncbi:long-chain-acyl-CoA synthetase [Acidipila rosea]|uniref:Fatty-acyl-CoA synthase n=1 Tax=Acidipila rosea TaxID=768535 RepID=A0A4R1KXW2_9BACT|nr:long-chain-acyl-CoA synthetase [Acidipila rosea]TCK70258.1 fatty-acyl-CoA synthase [Acidipila rosea]
MSQTVTKEAAYSAGSVNKAWLRALERTATIHRAPDRLMSIVIDELAADFPSAPALLSDRESFSYQDLATRQNQYARWALSKGLGKGEVVCLLMPNRPEYLAIWLGLTSIGGVVVLLNTNLAGPSLSHCINVTGPKHLIVAAELRKQLNTAIPYLSEVPMIWTHGAYDETSQRIDLEIDLQDGCRLSTHEHRSTTIKDLALYVMTSGTTGLPKAAKISHARIVQWGQWFAGMMCIHPGDRIYNCLPMYHSIGGVLVPCASLAGGGSVVIREKFSASHFWSDVIRWDCTMFQYIGEFCRYLIHATTDSDASPHRVRMACGNGMAAEVWNEFQDKFRIPQVLEFYASTEGGVSLFNIEGKRGSIGRIPPYLAHRFSTELIVLDIEKRTPVRNEYGFCVRCPPNEIGEAIGKIVDGPSALGTRYEGYTDKQASDEKVLHDVFEAGDSWVRTGDLMRIDEKGFFYFVDRVGESFRWKGENVSTLEVSEAICRFAGVKYAAVYGVAIPATDGRAGMAALVTENELDLSSLRTHLVTHLPAYARPMFLRFCDGIEVTRTFKYSKRALVAQGYAPYATNDDIYFDDLQSGRYTKLDVSLYNRIQTGDIRL